MRSGPGLYRGSEVSDDILRIRPGDSRPRITGANSLFVSGLWKNTFGQAWRLCGVGTWKGVTACDMCFGCWPSLPPPCFSGRDLRFSLWGRSGCTVCCCESCRVQNRRYANTVEAGVKAVMDLHFRIDWGRRERRFFESSLSHVDICFVYADGLVAGTCFGRGL